MNSFDMAINGGEGAADTSGRQRRQGGILLRMVVGIWLAVIAFCLVQIERYTAAPGNAGAPPGQWPAGSYILPDPSRPTLLLFAHPQCPCTRATIGELNTLMAHVPGRVNAQVWFVKPDHTEAGWTNTDLWASAAAIPGVTVHADQAGREAELFRAETSGEALLYATDGRLLFQGGITVARGHAGDNPGRSAVADLLMGSAANPLPVGAIKTPVYGCSLFNQPCPAGGYGRE